VKTENDGYHDDTDDKMRNLLWSSWEMRNFEPSFDGEFDSGCFLWDITKHREFMYGLDVSESRVYHGIPSSSGHIHLESAKGTNGIVGSLVSDPSTGFLQPILGQ